MKRSNDTSWTHAGPVTVFDAATGEHLRTDEPYTRKELKAIIDNDRPHANSIASRIKDDPALRAKFDKNMQAYYEDLEATRAQLQRGINASSLTEPSILEV